MVFNWSLSDSKSSQVSRTLLSILADLNNAVVSTVSTRSVISQSSSPGTNPLVTVLRAPIGIIVTFMFHSFFNSLARSRYISLFLNSFNFTLWSAGTAKSTILQVLCFVLIMIRSGHLAEIRWSICYYYYYYYYYYYSFRVFHISVSWWFFSGVWVTASLLKSPGLVSVFWPSSAMLSIG